MPADVDEEVVILNARWRPRDHRRAV